MNRVVIVTTGARHSVAKGIAELVRHFPGTEWLIVQHEPPRTWRRVLKGQWGNLRHHGWRWIPYEIADVAARDRTCETPQVVGEKPPPAVAYTWATVLAMPGVRQLVTPSLHGPATLAAVRDFAPDLGLVLAGPILKSPLFETPRLGTINLHKGILPDFRGMPPAFWELYENREELGCTVHRVDRGLDTGPILLQRRLPRRRFATVRGAAIELDEVGVRLTCEGVAMMLDGMPSWTPQTGNGRTFRKPTLRQEAELRRRLTHPHPVPRPRRVAKDVIFAAYEHVLRPLPRLALAARGLQRVIVLVYHRVNDDVRDSLTVGIEQFDEQMAFLAARYPVASLEDVVAGTVRRDTVRPVVTLTFDDGYRDNWEFAVPILARHRIPATFFVTTAKIGSDWGFGPHWRYHGQTLSTMTWTHLARMQELGFTIGSHTATHINCSHVDAETLHRELTESRDALRNHLGIEHPLFAYPFGKREDITPEALELVRKTGYSGCVSAYGGANAGRIDPFSVRRVGIDYATTMARFRAVLEGFSR